MFKWFFSFYMFVDILIYIVNNLLINFFIRQCFFYPQQTLNTLINLLSLNNLPQ